MSKSSPIADDFKALLSDAIKGTLQDGKLNLQEVVDYTAKRAAHLATLASQPGFDEAVKAEVNNVAMYAGIQAVEMGDATDARILGIIEGTLTFASKALANMTPIA